MRLVVWRRCGCEFWVSWWLDFWGFLVSEVCGLVVGLRFLLECLMWYIFLGDWLCA